jgi:chromosome segregation ATPase
MLLQKALTTEPMPGAAAGANAPMRPKKMNIKEAQKIKQDLKLEETTCLQVESLKRTAQLKGLFDKRAGLQAEVDTLTRGNEDEAKSIEIEKKSFEDLKITMEAEEKADAENKFKKLNTVSASLARFKETIDKKKKSLVDRIALREQQIQRLVLSKNEVVVKELDVNSKLQNAGRTRQSFRDRCCSGMRGSRYTRTSSSTRTTSSSYTHPSCATESSSSSGSSEPSTGR